MGLVKLSKSMSNFGELMSTKDFKDSVKNGIFNDFDGFGHYVYEDEMIDEDSVVLPSKINEIPDDVTHVMWFNK